LSQKEFRRGGDYERGKRLRFAIVTGCNNISMGLEISTHSLVQRRENDTDAARTFLTTPALVNDILVSKHLHAHQEPETRGAARARRHAAGFPYACLHALRRAFARVRMETPVTPLAPGENPASDPAIQKVSAWTHTFSATRIPKASMSRSTSATSSSTPRTAAAGRNDGVVAALDGGARRGSAGAAIDLAGGELSDAEVARINGDPGNAPF
jgi:hypothetical protein